MPRKPRTFSSIGIYHITLRSVNQHIIFEEDDDYVKFLFYLTEDKAKFDIDILAYCIMDNHVHLLIHSKKENLSPFFQSFASSFARWYNRKYSRSGHLFQGRFHSVAVETESQFLATLVYIHNNPVKAAACLYPSEYRWTSYRAFYGEKNSIINLDYSYKLVGSREYLLNFFASYKAPDEEAFSSIHQEARQFVSDGEAMAIFLAESGLASTSEVVHLPKRVRNELIRTLCKRGLTQKQIARVIDVSVATVKRALSATG